MHKDAKKVAAAGASRAARELPMPLYKYQVMKQASGPQNDQSAVRKPVKDQKIKSLQNLSFA
jgi:hypothetical protein